MLTKLTIRNFKVFESVEIELGSPVVFIGPNNSGKTSALQALALWNIGLKRWSERRGGKAAPEKRPGVTINRRDLVAVPVPAANLLWRNLQVRNVQRSDNGQKAENTQNVRVDIIVEGVTNLEHWKCGLEFDYANPESFYCRPLRLDDNKNPERMPVPEDLANQVDVAFLPPMSGLADREFMKQRGEIDFLIGQGRTAEVLRNLCYQLITAEGGAESWRNLTKEIKKLFGVELSEPRYVAERSEIEMTYQDPSSGAELDISSSGRGLQQTLLLLAYLAEHPRSVLLLDEPDAHLEILRQRRIYQILTEKAEKQGSQIVAASHSEVILNEAADRDVVVAFLGRRPHRIDDRGGQLIKSLKDIGFEDYYQAEQTGWVLYLEGSTDLAMLRAFAERLGHIKGQEALAQPFVKYVESNDPSKVRNHFYGIREAKPDIVGFALFDRINARLQTDRNLHEHSWERREIENYLCQRETLMAWAENQGRKNEGENAPLLVQRWINTMEDAIAEVESAMQTLGKGSPWSIDTKVSDDFLTPLFATFYRKLNLPNLMSKTNFHVLASFVPKGLIDLEVVEAIDNIVVVVGKAKPAR
ncbi:MAG: AAA family ATPase [Candidatus Chloroheliales bacterium]|nr:MAG: AAA family ATPase [Chloroflexota bacterium]